MGQRSVFGHFTRRAPYASEAVDVSSSPCRLNAVGGGTPTLPKVGTFLLRRGATHPPPVADTEAGSSILQDSETPRSESNSV